MDEDVGVRMTRLRRRLSVEQNDEVSSPATPTKKRASKLAKPQLENIVENAIVNSPKRSTRRSIATESADTAEGKVSTPGTRAARIKPNVSLLENVQALESPRTKRASRRNSLAGSDNENATVSTPIRRSRRISKEYNKSPETADHKIILKRNKESETKTQEVIVEEGDKEDDNGSKHAHGDINKSIDETVSPAINNSIEPTTSKIVEMKSAISGKNSPAKIRKSPRLSFKNSSNEQEETFEGFDDKISQNKHTETQSDICNNTTKLLSMDKANKTLPIIRNKQVSANKKKRSKSCTYVDVKSKIDGHTRYSDGESRKVRPQRKVTNNLKQETILKSQEIGDHEKHTDTNTSTSPNASIKVNENKENEIHDNTGLRLYKKNLNISQKSSSNITGVNTLDISTQQTTIENSIAFVQKHNDKKEDISSTIFLEDSDANEQTSDAEKSICRKKLLQSDGNDDFKEISPRSASLINEGMKQGYTNNSATNMNVVNVFAEGKGDFNNDSCEPMDIDETIIENNSLIDYDLKTKSKNTSLKDLKQTSKLSSSKIHQNNGNTKVKENSHKEKERTGKSDELQMTNNVSQSTLILSVNNIDQSSEENTSTKNRKLSESKTPKAKSCAVNIIKDIIDTKNVSVASGAGVTPARHKTLQNIGVFTSTPVLEQSNNRSKECSFEKRPNEKNRLSRQSEKNNDSLNNEESENTSSDDEQKCTLFDSKAKNAGNDYESGDSQDEAEREYIEQNEIPIEGETLESGEDFESEDSDYEKNSFLVSSAEEDYDLLTGSGDDLSLSDNELKMTSKSKNKYNKRKMKEQKQASREMFEARHGKTNVSVDKDDTEDPDIIFVNKKKKRNRLRLDSSKDISDAKICADEQEMTIVGNNSLNEEDPLLNIFPIKQEVLELSANNTSIKEIENVELDQDVTIFANNESRNPLINFDDGDDSSESSDDGGIGNKYSSLLRDLNSSKSKNVYEDKGNKSLNNIGNNSVNKQNLKKDNSLLDKLNLTGSGKEKNMKIVTKQSLSSNVSIISTPPGHSDSQSSDTKLDDIGKKSKKNISLEECKDSKKKKENSLLENLNISDTKGNKKKTDCTDLSQQSHNDSQNSSKSNTKTNEGTISNKRGKKNISLNDYKTCNKEKNNSLLDKLNLTDSRKHKIKTDIEVCQPNQNDPQSALSKFIYTNGNDTIDSKDNDVRKKDISFTEHKDTKNEKETSLLYKFDLANTGKQKKTEVDKQKVMINIGSEQVQQINDESSSDSINIKLLFASDEDSNDMPNKTTSTKNHEEYFIPLKKSEAKMNLLDNTIPLIKTDNIVSDHGANFTANTDNSKEVKQPLKNKDRRLEKTENICTKSQQTKIKSKKTDQVDILIGEKNNGEKGKQDSGKTQESSRKRKERDNDIPNNSNKVYITGLESKMKVQRLPQSIIAQLDDKPQNMSEETKTAVMATSTFEVEAVRRRKNKPSLYLEDSIHIDEPPTSSADREVKPKKAKILAYIPKASASNVGFTSNFKVKVMKQEKRLDATQAGLDNELLFNFKAQRLYGSNIKRVATEELCRKQKRLKITKF